MGIFQKISEAGNCYKWDQFLDKSTLFEIQYDDRHIIIDYRDAVSQKYLNRDCFTVLMMEFKFIENLTKFFFFVDYQKIEPWNCIIQKAHNPQQHSWQS